MQEILLGAFNTLQRSIELISIQDIIDMGIIAYVIYRGMKLLKDTSAMRLAKGILIIFAGPHRGRISQSQHRVLDLTAGLLLRRYLPGHCLPAGIAPYAGTARQRAGPSCVNFSQEPRSTSSPLSSASIKP